MAGGQPIPDLLLIHQLLRRISFHNIPFVLASDKIRYQELDGAKPVPRSGSSEFSKALQQPSSKVITALSIPLFWAVGISLKPPEAKPARRNSANCLSKFEGRRTGTGQ